MRTNQRLKEKRKRERASNAADRAFTNARAAATHFALGIFRYINDLPGVVNCDTNLDHGPTPFFAFTSKEKHWFGNTICFDYGGNSYRLYFGFRFNSDEPSVESLMGRPWPKDVEPLHAYKHLANYWIQLNKSKTYEPHGPDSVFLVRFDASPDWQVDVFPHHKHLYINNVDTDGLPFGGTRDQLLEELGEIIQNEP